MEGKENETDFSPEHGERKGGTRKAISVSLPNLEEVSDVSLFLVNLLGDQRCGEQGSGT